ncbi:MAG: polyprenyl synthetase family protein, partial [Treponema sp.]|nr:polyprenyl synthetase family protein [Treponema sp.]
LIAAATKAGAIMGGANDEVIDAMYEYGRLIGLAFQIQDDYLQPLRSRNLHGRSQKRSSQKRVVLKQFRKEIFHLQARRQMERSVRKRN